MTSRSLPSSAPPDPPQRGSAGFPPGALALHGAVALFGVAGLFGKWLHLHPLMIVAGRVGVASAAFILLIRLGGSRVAPPGVPLSFRERVQLGGCGALLAFHWFAFFQGIQLSSVALGLLAYATAPVFVTLLEPLWFRERFSFWPLVLALLTLAGVALIVPPQTGDDPGSMAGFFTPQRLGLAWGVASGLSFAVLSLLNRALVRRHSGLRVAFHQDAAALVFLLPWLPWVWQPPTPMDWVLLVVLGLACTAVAHTLFIQALASVRARTAAITSALEPVYGIVLAWWWLGESPSLRTMAGGALILAAVVGAGVGDRTQPASLEPPSQYPA